MSSLRPSRVRSLAAIAALVCLSGCSSIGVLDPRGPVGEGNRTILLDSLAIMLAIVIPTIVATFAFAWWFRSSNSKALHLPEWEYSGRLELVIWSIPALTIMFLGGIAWIGSHDLDPYHPLDTPGKPVEVQAVSLDWKWLFIYPEQGVASVNQLVVPAFRPIHFSLTSASVMNAFFVPQLGSMIYTMNGMTTQLNLQADELGSFHGLSSHYSGDGFSDMHFELRAVSDADFGKWVEDARANGKPLDNESYDQLAKQSVATAPAVYKSVEPGLFGEIASQKLPPAPGPAVEVSPKVGD